MVGVAVPTLVVEQDHGSHLAFVDSNQFRRICSRSLPKKQVKNRGKSQISVSIGHCRVFLFANHRLVLILRGLYETFNIFLHISKLSFSLLNNRSQTLKIDICLCSTFIWVTLINQSGGADISTANVTESKGKKTTGKDRYLLRRHKVRDGAGVVQSPKLQCIKAHIVALWCGR